MIQSAVLKACYEEVYKLLLNLGGNGKLFVLSDEGGTGGADKNCPSVYLGISDMCQLCHDKNGEKVEVDEMVFEAPTRVSCMLHVAIVSKQYPKLLETAGLVVQHFKDNHIITLEGYQWHGDSEGKVFIEPVVRNLEPGRQGTTSALPTVTLGYSIEVGINSLKGTPFKRVEKKKIESQVLP